MTAQEAPMERATAALRPSTPLGVIARFVPLVETITTAGLVETHGFVQVALTAFVITFPFFIFISLFVLLWNKPEVLFAPMEYEQVRPQEFAAVMHWKNDPKTIDHEVEQVLKNTKTIQTVIDSLPADTASNDITTSNVG
jgi:hypothetical protein